jgi:cytochrome c-type biogenesis protein CcmF
MILGEGDLAFALLFTIVAVTVGMYTLRPNLARKLIPALVAFLAVAVTARAVGVTNYLYLLFLSTAAMAVVSNASHLVGFLPDRWRYGGAHLTHFGFGLLILGVLASSAFVVDEKLVIPKGESRSAFGLEIAYEGMEHALTHPKNQLLLTVHDGGDVSTLRPQLYYSERMNGIMRKPSIRKTGLYDLYFAPEQVQTDEMAGGLKLAEGQSQTVGEYQLTFDGFELGDHGGGGNMKVLARLFVQQGERLDTLMPAIQVVNDSVHGSRQESRPAMFADGSHQVAIEQVLADEHAVVLAIPGLVDTAPPERLVLDISRKMLIDLVWLGAVLIIAGLFISFLRRRAEASA